MGGSVTRHRLVKRKSFTDIQTVHRLTRQVPQPLIRSFTLSALKLFRVVNHSNNSNQSLLSKDKGNEMFSEYEIQMVRDSWRKVREINENFGLEVYRRIFECEPNMKMLFSWRDIKTENLLNEPQFRRQAFAIMGVIDRCVQSMDKIQTTSAWLRQLGKYHTKLRGYGFKPEHWVLFKLSILLSLAFVIDDSLNRQELLEAWNNLITFIVETMKVGFNSSIKDYFEAGPVVLLPVRRHSAE